jgi:two-component system chemotaxis sensor kinase CheA
VILVTSLSSEEDKKTGIDAGADAYITKGAFDQGNLISTIRQLL